jgi:hypothetical protein
VYEEAVYKAAEAHAWHVVPDSMLEEWEEARAFECANQCRLLREIVGNPFRPRTLDLAGRSEAVLGLARSIYHSRDFTAMRVLSDALEEAGCQAPDVLAHCREPGEHVRGCWVLDLVLAKDHVRGSLQRIPL